MRKRPIRWKRERLKRRRNFDPEDDIDDVLFDLIGDVKHDVRE